MKAPSERHPIASPKGDQDRRAVTKDPLAENPPLKSYDELTENVPAGGDDADSNAKSGSTR